MKKRIILSGFICIIFLLGFVYQACAWQWPWVKNSASYIGTWIRQATFTNGELVGTNPATLKMQKSSFDSKAGGYFVKGKIETSADKIKMITESTNCPGHSAGTVTVHTYSVSEDGKTLTLINTQYGARVKEVYKRK